MISSREKLQSGVWDECGIVAFWGSKWEECYSGVPNGRVGILGFLIEGMASWGSQWEEWHTEVPNGRDGILGFQMGGLAF